VPKLHAFKVRIETGEPGMGEAVRFNINGFSLPFENGVGGTAPGQTFEAGYDINSFPHSLTLVGPEKGRWNIKKIAVDYQCVDVEPYSVLFGEVTLDETSEVDIWREPPLPAFDV
jgi:hypothetical protein